MMDFIQKSIKRKFLFSMITVMVLTCIATSILFFIQYTSKVEQQAESAELIKKRDLLTDITETYNSMVFKVRGYLSFSNENELEVARSDRALLEAKIREANQISWNDGELDQINALEDFVTVYWEERFPPVQDLIENQQYDQIHAIGPNATTDEINLLIYELNEIASRAQLELNEENRQFLERVEMISYSIFSLLIVVVLILAIVFRNLSKDIGRPLVQLSEASEALAQGKYHDLPSSNNQDEIGKLTRSFRYMAEQMTEREENLSAQNEELIAQQDMLEGYVNDLKNKDLALDASAMVAQLDREGWIVASNSMLADASLYRERELEGRHFLSIVEMSEFEGQTDLLEAFPGLNHGRVWSGELTCVRKDGEYFYTHTAIVPNVNEHGDLDHYIVIQQDISEQVNTSEKLKTALQESEEAKSTVEKMNHLNQSLSATMDVTQLLDVVVQRLSYLYPFDYGMILILGSNEFSTIGMDGEWTGTYDSETFSHVIERLHHEKYFLRERKVSSKEQGHLPASTTSYDLHVPLYDSTEKLTAVLAVTRIGNPFTTKEIDNIYALLERVSLYLERIDSFEQTEINRQLNQDVIDNINEGILFVDDEGKIVQYNRNWLFFLNLPFFEHEISVGLPIDKWLKQVCHDVVDCKSFVSFFRGLVYSETAPSDIHTLEVESDEGRRVIELYGKPVYHNDDKEGTLFVFRDITTEYELNEMKTNLVSTVSHELRTPLASVLGYTELMIHRNLSEDRQKKYLNTIHSEAKRLTNLINDFLDLQRMESGRETFRREQLDLKVIVEEVADNLQVGHMNHKILVKDHTTHSIVQADRGKLIQMFTNLVGNAVKFSPGGGEVIIVLTNDDHKIFAHISDEGVGIPEYEIEKLFTKFHRIDNSSQRKIGGTGLGLSISKEIAESHDGKITVHSELGVGSIFTVMLPIYETKRGGDSSSSILPKVVLVEDDSHLSDLITDELKELSIKVSHYNEGGAVIQALDSMQPDAFIIDLTLADRISGWEVIEAIKKVPHLKDVPIVISSALNESEKSAELEIEGYLVKPYPLRKLSTIILQTVIHQKNNGQILIANEPLKED